MANDIRDLMNDEYYITVEEKIYSKNDGSSIWTVLEHTQDDILHSGYNYTEKGILGKVISILFFLDPKRAEILKRIDKIWIKSVNDVKRIKRLYNYAVDRNLKDFN